MASKSVFRVVGLLARQSRTTPIFTSRIPILSIPQSTISNTRIQWNSTQPQTPPQPQTTEPPSPPNPPPNAHRNFYKEFGRPVAKVFLMAIFTYQLVYFFWAALDNDATVREREDEVRALEEKLEEVMKGKGKGKEEGVKK